jgi:hypothetical protein
VLLASWMGWGELVRLLVRADAHRVGWGLRAGWGISAVLAICGFLQWAQACNQTVLTVITLGGAFTWILSTYESLRTSRQQRRFLVRLRSRRWIAYSPILLLLIYMYATSVIAYDLDWWDDLPNYLVYVKKLLQTGIIIEPYSLRRLLTFGGQQVLDAQLLIGGTFFNIDILEQGLARIVFVGLVLEIIRPVGKRKRLLAASVIAIFLLVPRTTFPWLNTHSEMTGVILFLTLLRTLAMENGRQKSWRLAALAGIIAAAISTMRVSYLPAAVFSIGLCYAARMILDRSRWKMYLAHLAIAGVTCAVLLLPWSAVLYESSRTFLHPLWQGNQRPEFAYRDAGFDFMQKIRWVLGFAAYPAAIVLALPLILALYRRFWRTELPMALAAGITVAMTLLTYTLTSYDNTYRFAFPVTYGLAAVMVLLGILRARSRVQRWFAAAALALIAAVYLLPGIRWEVADRGQVWSQENNSPLQSVAQSARAYERAQNAVPQGARIFSATSFPLLFDYARNPIFIADVPGAASPPPGMPLFQGSAAVADYLKKQGIHYVIFTFPEADRTLYSREYWTLAYNHPESVPPDHARNSTFFYHFIQAMEDLPALGKVLYRSRTLCVVQLE